MEPSILECSFYIPIRRDANLSDGELHESDVWEWLELEMFTRFRGGTSAPGFYRGFYEDPDTGEKVDDESRKFIVTFPEPEVDTLRTFLAEACVLFQQKCIYLSISGKVEFIRAKK